MRVGPLGVAPGQVRGEQHDCGGGNGKAAEQGGIGEHGHMSIKSVMFLYTVNVSTARLSHPGGESVFGVMLVYYLPL